MKSTVPIEASGIIPVSTSDVANIPSIALVIPDFEGEAILRIFANSTENEIGCYSAVITNGASFSQPKAVGTVLGVFTVIAVLASFATAIYGDNIQVIRKHYAHSLSVFVVFAVFQHIFFTGALSMNWPSVLVAWWSNFAWAGGMIYSSSMQASINHLIGNNVGNTSQVGAAGAGTTQETLGGGYDLSLIYGRSLSHLWNSDIARDIYQRDHSQMLKRDVLSHQLEQGIQRRALANSSTGYSWYGKPVGAGLPLPGNYSGFAGTLAEEDIRVSNAFMTGFLWFLILLVLVAAAVAAFKWALEAFVAIKLMKQDRLAFFRQHWMGYTALAALRTLFIGFFMMMLLTMFQFSYDSSGGVKAIAAIVFLIFMVGMFGAVIYACYYRARQLGRTPKSDEAVVENTEEQKPTFLSKIGLRQLSSKRMSTFSRRTSQLGEESASIHDDEDYVKRFGWLSARFRRTRWWFFAAWVLYEFIRACFYAGASGRAMTQVFGLLVVEFLAFCGILWARPFEGRRLNVIVVYILGFSKVVTVALSAAFDIGFNLPRITTTVIGIAIIIVQGILTIVTLIAIAVGAVSTYLSLTRNHEEIRPKAWMGMREKYFRHLDQAATDIPRPPTPLIVEEESKGPYFNVSGVRRIAKIEDEDPDFVAEMTIPDEDHTLDSKKSYAVLSQRSGTPGPDAFESTENVTPIRRNRATSKASMHSMSYTNLPYGARPHRPSWSTRDFSEWNAEHSATRLSMAQDEEPPAAVTPQRAGTVTSANSDARTPIGRPPARSATLPTALIRPMASASSLRVGGGTSTPDTIGAVPSPNVRPRSGTFNGRGGNGSRSNTPTPGNRSSTPTMRLDLPIASSSRPLTPAAEMDELFREVTREDAK